MNWCRYKYWQQAVRKKGGFESPQCQPTKAHISIKKFFHSCILARETSCITAATTHPIRRHLSYDNKLSTTEPPWKILFFGTDHFSTHILKALHENRSSNGQALVKQLEVVSNPDQTPVREYASSVGLTIYDWPIPDLTGQFDVGILASFGHLIPKRILNMFPNGILNIHPSLLPRWRGASPIIHTILAGDTVSGISLMKLRPKHFDIGTVLTQDELIVPEDVTAFKLRDILAEKGAQMLVDTLRNLANIDEQEQTKEGVTYAHKVTTSMSYLNWDQQTSDDVYRQFRALGQLMHLRSELNGQRVKLLDIHQLPNDTADCDAPGTVGFDKGRRILCVKCKTGCVGFGSIIIRKTMTAQAFYNGYLQMAPDRKLCFTSIQNGLEPDIYNKTILNVR